MVAFGVPKLEFSLKDVNEKIVELEYEHEIFNCDDPLYNLKDDTWISAFQKEPSHLEFRRCWEERLDGIKPLKKLLWQECFDEYSKEWKMRFDSRYYQTKFEIYNQTPPDFFN